MIVCGDPEKRRSRTAPVHPYYGETEVFEHPYRSKVTEPVSLLLPVCNEAEGIESIVVEMMEVVFRYLPEGSEFLINEGGSTDGTKDVLRDLSARWPVLDISYKEEKEGFANAARSLYRRARCPLLFFSDSDGQCVVSEFWKLVPHIADADFVLGRKKIRYDPLLRRISSRCFNALARAIFHLPLYDINYGFRLSRREALMDVLPHVKHMPTLLNAEVTIVAVLRGHRVKEVPVYHRPRLYGVSRGLVPNSMLRESWVAFKGLRAMARSSKSIEKRS
jgi:dolichol-phosphate mannosyltransferase